MSPLIFSLFVLASALFTITLILGRILMDIATLLAKLSALSASVDALIAKGAPPAIDLQPVADAIDVIAVKVTAAVG